MYPYYEKIADLWRAEKKEQAVVYFWKCKEEELLSEEEIKELEKFLSCIEVMEEMYKKASKSTQEKIKKLLGIED
jgi:hypothetical protein